MSLELNYRSLLESNLYKKVASKQQLIVCTLSNLISTSLPPQIVWGWEKKVGALTPAFSSQSHQLRAAIGKVWKDVQEEGRAW